MGLQQVGRDEVFVGRLEVVSIVIAGIAHQQDVTGGRAGPMLVGVAQKVADGRRIGQAVAELVVDLVNGRHHDLQALTLSPLHQGIEAPTEIWMGDDNGIGLLVRNTKVGRGGPRSPQLWGARGAGDPRRLHHGLWTHRQDPSLAGAAIGEEDGVGIALALDGLPGQADDVGRIGDVEDLHIGLAEAGDPIVPG